MNDKTAETIDGGTLVRAPKTCECKTPDVTKNKIEEDDEWTCGTCKQLWRARTGTSAERAGQVYWKRVSKRTRKSKAKTVADAEKAGEQAAKDLVATTPKPK